MSGKALIPVLLLLLAGGGCSFLLRGKAEDVPPAPVYRDSLNLVITNALSEIPELEPMDQAIDSFMDFWSLHGVSLAVMRNDSLVYAKGYGMADSTTPMTPGTTLRIASVSKLLTAV
ncbi:MAG: serine hydrolase, partial [Bacteroidales bacterium]|nr:serine hydrolase [Bacteroidales bacterium]